jgi:hypothetical protein
VSLRVPPQFQIDRVANDFFSEIIRRLTFLITSPDVTPSGNDPSTATFLASEYTEVVNVTSSTNVVKLPQGRQGLKRTVTNNSAVSLSVYPFEGETINNLTTPYSVAPGVTVTFYAPGPRWFA